MTFEFPEKVKKGLVAALDARGITPEKIAEKIGWLLNQEKYEAVDKGIAHAAKIGVGGGYAPEKSVTMNLTGSLADIVNRLEKP